MTSLTITLPDEVAKLAEEQGLLSATAFETYILEKTRKAEDAVEYPPGFDMRLKGAVNPDAYGRGQILGDIESPIPVEWEAMKK
jgi:hypothetical protein